MKASPYLTLALVISPIHICHSLKEEYVKLAMLA